MEKNYDAKLIEKHMQKLWLEHDIYKFENNSTREIYSIDTPPPTVSGSLHIGHIFSYTQAEMIARFKRMQGLNVFYPFGFDDNGLPTERLVEKDEGILAKNLPRSEFIKKCISTSGKYEKEFKDLWQSLGFSVDWSLQYETVNPRVQRISQRSFIELVNKGKAYLKESPVLWCVECQTSIAQAELETIDIETNFSYIPFTVEGEQLPVATTRPELLYGCVCLFINPEDEGYSKYIGKTALVPLYNYEIPILADEKVSLTKGTGIVMCATFGDSTDVDWYKTYNLQYRKVILPNGLIDDSVPYIGGLKVTAARKEIIRLLSEHGLLIKSEKLTHMVAVHERCGKEIEFIPSKQWYIDVLADKELFLKAADQINWYPEHMKNRYTAWVNNLKWDWCISRQRYFGVPFPVWYCKNCGKAILAEPEQLPVNPLEGNPLEACSCGCKEFIPESSVLDTWATSSVTPLINSKWGEADDMTDKLLPMSLRTQAHDIIRTWAFYTIVKSLYHTGNLPWKDVMICGFVLAKKGEKISKSKGTAELSPPVLIDSYSADVLRYWAANSKLGTDTFFSVDELVIPKRFITKLWNASKFCISHLEDIELKDDSTLLSESDLKADSSLSVESGMSHSRNTMLPIVNIMLPVDNWIIERCKQTTMSARNLLDNYEIGSARQEIDDFFWKDFCDYYLEIVKERLYQPEIHGYNERKSAQFALYYCLLNILKLYAIYVPHITEYIYQEFFRAKEGNISLHSLCWDKDNDIDADIILFGEKLKEVIASVRKYKSENNLSMKTDMDKVVIHERGSFAELFKLTIKDIKACCRAKEVEIL